MAGEIVAEARSRFPHRAASDPAKCEDPLLSSAPVRIPAQSERKVSTGTFDTAESVAENLFFFSHAELCLKLIVDRIQPYDPDKKGARPPTISDDHWTKWTGLKPRMKDLAIKGLLKKGLVMHGRGKSARYYWDETAWQTYVRDHQPGVRSKATEGQKRSVPAKPGMQVHPDCSLKGCQKLCDTQGCENVVSIATGPEFAQHVAQTDGNSQILKNRERKGEDWVLSLAAVQNFFPASDFQFISKLLLAVKQRVKDFTDEQLAAAIRAAHKRSQTSEGLFLQTVPGALIAVIEGRIGNQRQAPKLKFTAEEIQAHLDRAKSALRKAGMDDLAKRVHLIDPNDLGAADDALVEIEKAALERLPARSPVDVIRAAIEPELKRFKEKMTHEQLNALRGQLINRKLLEDAGLSRMSLYYL